MSRELVASAQAGSHDAFDSLIARSIDSLYATARLILRNDDQAEDAVQDALIRAWLGIRGLRDPDRFDAWLRRLTVHACYRAFKRGHDRRVVEIPMIEPVGSAATDVERSLVARDRLERGFRRLMPDQRAVLVVHFYLDLPDAEAADVLGIPIGTMKSRLHRATAALKSALDANDREPELVTERLI